MPSPPSRPANVVVIMTDQQRADVCAREGFALDTTPNLDALAAEGAWFDRAYTSSPLCCPARTSLLTGRFPSAHRVTTNPAVNLAVFDDSLFATARALGHATALVGKNHTWMTAADADEWVEFSHEGQLTGPRTDTEAAFDDWLRSLRHRTTPDAAPFAVEQQLPVRIVDHATRWIDSVPPDRPFTLWLSFPEPHNPYQCPEPYYSMFPPSALPPTDTDASALDSMPFAWRYLHRLGLAGEPDYDALIPRARSSYFGMLRLIDDQIGRFVDGLRASGRLEDTLLICTADHGDYVGEYGLVRKGADLPEVLTRIPLVVRGPGVDSSTIPRDEHVSICDIYPTVCDALGVPIPPGVQGRSLWPSFTGAEPRSADRFDSVYAEQGMGGRPYGPDDVTEPLPGLMYDDGAEVPRIDELNAVTQSGRRRMVRRGRWKLIVDQDGTGRLFDLDTDPRELTDRAGEPMLAAVEADLLRTLAWWMLRAEDPLPVPEHGYRVLR